MRQSYLKILIRTICISVFLSLILFYLKEVNFELYLALTIALFVFVFISYCLFKSKRFYFIYGLVAASNLIVYLIQKYNEGYRPNLDLMDLFFIGYAVAIACVLFFEMMIKAYCRLRKIEDGDGKADNGVENLFSERTYDLLRIVNYLRKFNLIGVVSKWGDGKSFLFEMLKKECGSRYYVVKIGVMSVTIDTVEKFILNEINYLLEFENIFSSASTKINNMLSSQSSLSFVGDMFLTTHSFTDQIKVLKEDVLKLKKRIVLVFEDIDRIADELVIYKIFSIAETLSSDHIKIVFQYNEMDLLNVLKRDKSYLEKYIPHTVNLTSLSFKKVVGVLCDTKKYSNVTKKDFSFIYLYVPIPSAISEKLHLTGNFKLLLPSFSIRKILIFLEDVDNSMNNYKNSSDELEKRCLIMFYTVKHFFYDIYNKITLDRDFLDVDLFEFDDETLTLRDLLNRDIDWNLFWNNLNNMRSILILILLGYDFKPILE